MAVWGVGIMMAPILGPTVGRLDRRQLVVALDLLHQPADRRRRASSWSARSCSTRRSTGSRAASTSLGIVLMVLGFGCLQLVLDLGERQDWFDSTLIVGAERARRRARSSASSSASSWPRSRSSTSACSTTGTSRVGTLAIFLIGARLQLEHAAAWRSTRRRSSATTRGRPGSRWRPGGLGTMIALMISGRLVSRMDQRLMLAFGCLLQAVAALAHDARHVDDGLLEPGLAALRAGLLAWASSSCRCRRWRWPPSATERLGNATAAYNVVRNIGGSVGVALATTLLARRSQEHQATLIGHVQRLEPGDGRAPARVDRALRDARAPTRSRPAGARWPCSTARRSMQAQVLAYADDFWLLLDLSPRRPAR